MAAAPVTFDTLQEVLDYLKTTRHDTADLSRCVKPHIKDTLLQLFLRINWMRTWFRTNHTNLMYKEDSPFKETVKLFSTIPEEDYATVFILWSLHLIQKLPIDTAYEVGGKVAKTTDDYDKQRCILNIISDLSFQPTAKTTILQHKFMLELKDVLNANLVRIEKPEFTLVTNPSLAQEISNELLLMASSSLLAKTPVIHKSDEE